MFTTVDYTWYICLSHISLAILLFFLVNWLGRHSEPLGYVNMSVYIEEETAPAFNFLFKALSPVVFIILVSIVFQILNLIDLNRNIFLITVYYWILRIFYVILFNKADLTNWGVQAFYWIVSIGLSFWVNSLIEDVDSILPDPKSLLEQFWILIIIFLYSIINKLEISRKSTIIRKNRYIERRFSELSKKYGETVNVFFKNDFYEAVTFSIMIYENFNRPRFARIIERCTGALSNKPHTYGVMQVMSLHPLSDEESLMLGMKKILEDTNQVISSEDNLCSTSSFCDFYFLRRICEKYNGGDNSYYDAVRSIYDEIVSNHYPKINGDIKVCSLTKNNGNL